MKALTLYQPWATLVALGKKTVETRSWWTGYTGLLAIHASKNSKYMVGSEKVVDDEFFRQTISGIYRTASESPFPFGKIVAICEMEGCVEMVGKNDIFYTNNWRHLGEQEIAFGQYEAGRYMWFLTNIQKLSKPIPVRGALGLWEWKNTEEDGGKNAIHRP